MLTKKVRLNRDSDFKKIYKKGRFSSSRYLRINSIVNIAKNNKKSFAVVVSKKISTKATDRNLYKRQIRHIIAQNIDIIPSGQYIISLKAKPDSFLALDEDLKQCLKKACLV